MLAAFTASLIASSVLLLATERVPSPRRRRVVDVDTFAPSTRVTLLVIVFGSAMGIGAAWPVFGF